MFCTHYWNGDPECVLRCLQAVTYIYIFIYRHRETLYIIIVRDY